MLKRLISLMLAFVLVMGMVPTAAFAQENETTATVQQSEETPAQEAPKPAESPEEETPKPAESPAEETPKPEESDEEEPPKPEGSSGQEKPQSEQTPEAGNAAVTPEPGDAQQSGNNVRQEDVQQPETPAEEAAPNLVTGQCGREAEEGQEPNEVSWIYNLETKTLTLSGTGETADADYDEGMDIYTAPWDAYSLELEELVVEEGVTAIGAGLFAEAVMLRKVTLPAGLKTIGARAFRSCEALQALALPDTLETIGSEAFRYCIALTEVTLPETTAVAEDAFLDSGIAEDEPVEEEPEEETAEEPAELQGIQQKWALEKASAATPAESVTVYVTVNNQGVLAQANDGSVMANKPVTVTDVNADGVLTYDEALVAAHEVYCPEGYATADSVYGTQVTKLWGKETGNTLYFKNGQPLTMNVGDTTFSTVAAGDRLYASVNKDNTYYADWYTYFDQTALTVNTGETFTLTLQGYLGMGTSTAAKAVSGVNIGTWNGSFAAIDGKTTDTNGQVTLSFETAGTYYVSASGTVTDTVMDWSSGTTADADCPIMAPVCIVTVEVGDVPVTGITLDKSEVSVNAGNTVTLTATVTPDNATDKTVIWTSSDESVATVADGVVTAVAVGEAIITAKAGEFEAVCTVTVNEALPTFSELAIYASQSAYNNGEAPLVLTPAYDPNTYTGYVISVPDYAAPAQSWESQTVYLVATAAEDSRDGYGLMYSNSAWSWGSGNLTDGVLKTNLAFMNKGYAEVYFFATSGPQKEAHYQFTSQYHTTLSALTIDGVLDQAFNRNVTRYHAYVDSTADGVKIVPTAFKSGYTVTVNGTAVNSGEEYTLTYDWKGGNKMDVEIVVSGDGFTTTTYTIELEKEPLNDTPFIMTQPVEADYIQNETSKTLSVAASANGEMTYQWYSNTADSNEGGTPIDGATGAEYTPSTAEVGTVYYYCVITNKDKDSGNVTASNTARVTVDPDPTPVVTLVNPGSAMPKDYDYPWNTGYVYVPGAEATPLRVEATSAAEGGTWSYTWYSSSQSAYNIESYSSLSNATNPTYTPDTSLAQANDKGAYYFCKVSYTFKGKTYTAMSTTGATYTEGEGDNAKTYDVNAAFVFIKVDSAATPTLTKQPVSNVYVVGASASKLSVSASRADRGTLTYQWYVSDTNSNEGGTAIEGATKNSYTLGTVTEPGTKYYYCVVTNTIQSKTASVASDVAQIKVSVVNNLKGSGTEDAPWEIHTAEDYKLVYNLVAEGTTFEGKYLKQMADITLPADWAPIGITKDGTHDIKSGDNLLPFSGTLDGDGKTLTIPEGGLPLLGYVKGATVKNLNIYGTKIAGYGLVNYLEGVGLSGEAICIDNVTLKSGSSTLKSGLIGTYITTNGYAGCSADFYVTIRNCTIEKDVVIGYDKDQSMIGSIAGRVHGTIENCVSHATVYGSDYVGGILGTRDNAMGTCSVTGCTFAGTVGATGEHVGGIVGGGYENSTAPNGTKVTVNNNKVTGSVTGKDKVGGILGGDSYVAQAWNAYSFKVNTFKGTVSATGGSYVGGIIGYYKSLNKFDDIISNYYSPNCGADKGIGFVQYVDTNSTTHETGSGATYFNTETSTSGCPQVNGCWWKTAHNRTDDPLGADAAKLCYTDVAVTGITLDRETAELTVGGNTLTMTATVTPNDATDKTVTWTSSNESVATVVDGVVTAVAVGEAVITAKAGTHEASCAVAVVGRPVCYEIKVSGSYQTEYTVGDALNLNGIKLTARWTNGEETELRLSDVTISGYNENKSGTQTITLSYGLGKAEITVTVKPKSTKITVSVSILGDSEHGETSAPHGLARGGLTTWVGVSSVEADTSETVWDVLQRVAQSNGITFVADSSNKYGTVYISAVNGLGEFDNGKNSGWMYTVNGTHPEVGVSARYVKNGDKIVLHYTDDYTYEEGGNNYGKNPTSTGTTSGTGSTSSNSSSSGTTTASDQTKAKNVINLINKIPTTVTKNSKSAIEAARKAYNALTETQKKLVTNYDKLTKAEVAYAKLTATDADKQKAKEVSDLIAKLGTITVDSMADVNAARTAYEALTDVQKLLVENLDVLEKAEAKLALLKAQGGENHYQVTGDYLEKLGTPSVGSIGGEWMVLGLARSGRKVADVEGYYASVVKYIQENIDENGRLHSAKSTENSRLILALTSLGYDVTDVAGYNLLTGLSSMDFVCKQGINGAIWALIALDSGNYPAPGGSSDMDVLAAKLSSQEDSYEVKLLSNVTPLIAGSDVTRGALIQCILDAQTPDGGWAIAGEEADSDMTGMALTALAPYYEISPAVKTAADKAVATLSRMQNDDGGFSTFGGGGKVATSESVSQVIVALSALGIDADTDSRFVKNGFSALDALLSYAVAGGGFKHIAAGELDGMATEQGYYALTAYNRFLEKKTSLYNMTDVVDMGGDSVEVPAETTVPAATEAAEVEAVESSGFPWLAMVLVVVCGAGVLTVAVMIPKFKKKDWM